MHQLLATARPEVEVRKERDHTWSYRIVGGLHDGESGRGYYNRPAAEAAGREHAAGAYEWTKVPACLPEY